MQQSKVTWVGSGKVKENLVLTHDVSFHPQQHNVTPRSISGSLTFFLKQNSSRAMVVAQR